MYIPEWRVGLSLIKTFKFKEYKGYTNYKGAHASSSPLKEVSLEVEASDKSNLFVAYREGYNWTHKGGGSLRFAGFEEVNSVIKTSWNELNRVFHNTIGPNERIRLPKTVNPALGVAIFISKVNINIF